MADASIIGVTTTSDFKDELALIWGELNNLELEEGMAAAFASLTYANFLLPSQGAMQAKLTVTLPGNAVIDRYEVKLSARAADQAFAAVVGQVRAESGEETGEKILTVNLGGVRTVSAATFASATNVRIKRVDSWTGTEFSRFTSQASFYDTDASRLFPYYAKFKSDVRTERLRITVVSDESNETLLGDLRLILPDAPRDLAISIDGGAPAWTLPGPTAPGPDEALTQDAWNSSSERLVDLAPALRELTGDPLSPEDKTFEILLTSAEAGFLEIEEHFVDYGVLVRGQVNGANAATISFDEEGTTDVPIDVSDVPPGTTAKSISLSVAGEFGAERRQPAVGGDAFVPEDAELPLCEVSISSERAMILRLGAEPGLALLTGLRLPLKAGTDGAEVRLLPWTNADRDLAQPGTAIDAVTGVPVSLSAGSDGWTTLFFGEAGLEVDPENPPWVAILVARGEVSVALTKGHGAQMRVGPPSGPWRAMPALFTTGDFAELKFPYRTIGEAGELNPPAPMEIEVIGAGAEPTPLDPVPTGTSISFEDIDVAQPQLRLTHFAPGSLDLSTINIVYDD